MRPIRLALEGFSSFHDRTEVDFRDADFFALVGPTGAGKSSVIDGMTFALYGRVARYDLKMVAPVINQRTAAAMVDLTFAVDDQEYRVVREVQRTSKGASTREARLERGDEVLAGDTRSVTREITALLGLDFTQFTRCVVLPQGAFAEFLHDEPADRRKLLIQLLDLGIYARMASSANERAKVTRAQVDLLDQQVEDLRQSGLQDPATLSARLDDLGAVVALVDERQPRLDDLSTQIAAAERVAADDEKAAALLAEVEVPDDVPDLADEIQRIDKECSLAHGAEEVATTARARAEKRRGELPERSQLRSYKELYDERADLVARVTTGESTVTDARNVYEKADIELRDASHAEEHARQLLERARRDHAAHDLSHGLAVGDQCPVCGSEIGDLPDRELLDLEALTDAVGTSATGASEARVRRDEARQALARYEEMLVARRERLGQVEAQLVDAPPQERLGPLEAEVATAEREMEEAMVALQAATDQRKRADARRDKLRMLERNAWDRLSDTRVRVALLEPPAIEAQELVEAWTTLARWAEEQRPRLLAEADRASARAADMGRDRTGLLDELEAACSRVGVEAGADAPKVAVERAIAEVRIALARADEARSRLDELVERHGVLVGEERVASTLGRLLRSDAFQQWLLDEAVEVLVTEASERLRELSTGHYSLAVDSKGEFLVVDHFNADETRLARTLSGGETFLASLALALALADRVAELAVEGAPRLESIFLDEGFGTLDPETLDVVIEAIESLRSQDRTVGLVSHVPDLAERVPVRFEVRRTGITSTVERVDR
jgi:exonuclease SbcC